MSTRELKYTYKVKCLTEGIDYEICAPMNSIPTCCPVQPATHIIDSNNIEILSKEYQEYLEIPRVVVQEQSEDITQGFFRVQQYTMQCPSNSITNYDLTFDYPVCVSSVKLICNPENDGDLLNNIALVNSPIGVISSNVDIGDKEIKVSNTVLQYVNVGTNLILTNFITTEDLGEIQKIYSDRVIVKTGCSNNWTVGSTYVKMLVKNIVDFNLHSSVPYISLGESKIGGSVIKPGILVRVIYENKSSNLDKHFHFVLEYTY